MTNLVLVLGAMDPEMSEIETLAAACGVPAARATSDGRPVTPATACRASTMLPDGAARADLVAWVECRPVGHTRAAMERDGGPNGERFVCIDHHAEGDAGYSRPPAVAVAASSLGQVIALLGLHGLLPATWERRDDSQPEHPGQIETWRDGAVWVSTVPRGERCTTSLVVPARLVVAAAADHCLAAAYAGDVPSVDPRAVERYRAEVLARPAPGRHERTVGEVMAAIEGGIVAMRKAPLVAIAGQPVRDLRALPGGTVPEAPECACIEGAAFLCAVTDRDGRAKSALMGAARPATVAAFLAAAKAAGLDTYGDPARGFAGAYGALTFPEVTTDAVGQAVLHHATLAAMCATIAADVAHGIVFDDCGCAGGRFVRTRQGEPAYKTTPPADVATARGFRSAGGYRTQVTHHTCPTAGHTVAELAAAMEAAGCKFNDTPATP